MKPIYSYHDHASHPCLPPSFLPSTALPNPNPNPKLNPNSNPNPQKPKAFAAKSSLTLMIVAMGHVTS